MQKPPHKNPWFPVKRIGYGAGLPIAWQGWVVLGVYLAAVMLAAVLLPVAVYLIVISVLTPLFVLIVYFRSDGEWRWRDGN